MFISIYLYIAKYIWYVQFQVILENIVKSCDFNEIFEDIMLVNPVKSPECLLCFHYDFWHEGNNRGNLNATVL